MTYIKQNELLLKKLLDFYIIKNNINTGELIVTSGIFGAQEGIDANIVTGVL